MFLMIGLLRLNGAISWWNAYACGRNWIEARMLGGWPWVMVCCGAIQSAIGFSMVYGTVELGALYLRSEEHTSELQSLMRISYAVFCLKKKNTHEKITEQQINN